MKARLKMGKVQPAAYKAMDALDAYVDNSDIDKLHQELIRIRASQINGCAYCVHLHSTDARKIGETEERIFLVSAWREAQDIFTDEEQLLFEMTEEITLIHKHGLSDAVYEKAVTTFGEEKTAQIIMIIVTVNAWNRIAVGLKLKPQL
ncbi:MAG: carboxymuconolactone decarboxylase family protein [Chitinophagales bacterium]